MNESKLSIGFSHGTSAEPFRRLRRTRMTDALRSMVRETELSLNDFIYPLFVVERGDLAGPVSSMPGISRLRLGDLDREIESILSLGLRSVLLFGLPTKKDATGSTGCGDDRRLLVRVHRPRPLRDRPRGVDRQR